MLLREENEFLTRIGPGTPMGELLRRYWLPVALGSELFEPDCPPVRVKLLGERLVAFRDTHGRVGLLDEFCAHRRASLFLGRNEECGLRCVYHGWKYDVEGRCVDMPNEPPESNFKDKIHLKAYPTVELGGVIWAYLGPKEKTPPPPKFKWTQVPEDHRMVAKVLEECNWLQALDGNFDTVHPGLLHRNLTTETKRAGTNPLSRMYVMEGSGGTKIAQQEIELTDYGFYYGAIRPWGAEEHYVNVNHFVLPVHQFRVSAVGGKAKSWLFEGHMVVPMDDENCIDYVWRYCLGDHREELEEIERERGRGVGEVGSDFRKIRNKDNDWLIDRQVQKFETYTGIEGINTQDHAVQESMGPIMDRTMENLGNSDKIVFAARQRLAQAARQVQDGGDPPGRGPGYYTIQPTARILPRDVPWREALKNEIGLASL